MSSKKKQTRQNEPEAIRHAAELLEEVNTDNTLFTQEHESTPGKIQEAATDPRSIDFYIKRLAACSEALQAMKYRSEDFNEALYQAKHKEVLCIYMFLDVISGQIESMRRRKVFNEEDDTGMRALLEIVPAETKNLLPEFIEYHKGLTVPVITCENNGK